MVFLRKRFRKRIAPAKILEKSFKKHLTDSRYSAIIQTERGKENPTNQRGNKEDDELHDEQLPQQQQQEHDEEHDEQDAEVHEEDQLERGQGQQGEGVKPSLPLCSMAGGLRALRLAPCELRLRAASLLLSVRLD